MQIGKLNISPPVVLSPMAGVTDSVFRRLIKRMGGCGLVMTEFTSAAGLSYKAKRGLRLLVYHEEERPITAQLFGSDPVRLADGARLVQDLGFEAVDLNLGCPANKVVKSCGGSALLRDLPLLKQLIGEIRTAVTITFTIKIRAGWDENEIVAVEVGRMAESLGVEGITLHPRTRVQGYSGLAEWSLIRQLKENVKIPVIGNGDIVSVADAVRMRQETGCDGIMIGRGALKNPWIFRQIQQQDQGEAIFHPGTLDKYKLIKDYFTLLFEEATPGAIGKMKQFASWFTHAIPFGAALRKRIYLSQSIQEVMAQIDEFFLNPGSPLYTHPVVVSGVPDSATTSPLRLSEPSSEFPNSFSQ
jgi:tRNA-dihydrouridine synthase B